MSRGGAFDPRAAVEANRAAGAADDAQVLEVVLAGPRLRFHVDAVIALAGAPFLARLDGVEVTVPTGPLQIRPGQVLAVGACARGVRCAIGVRGGLRGAPGVLGAGARLDVGAAWSRASRASPSSPPWALPEGELVLRVTEGPQRTLEDDGLLTQRWTVDPNSDRAGIRLRPARIGAPLRAAGRDIITTGVTVGAVQLPPSGAPIILGVDRATTGGYPVVAHVASADLWLLGQLRPAAQLRFVSVSFAEALALLR